MLHLLFASVRDFAQQATFTAPSPHSRTSARHLPGSNLYPFEPFPFARLVEYEAKPLVRPVDLRRFTALSNNDVFIFIGGKLPTRFLIDCGIEMNTHFGTPRTVSS